MTTDIDPDKARRALIAAFVYACGHTFSRKRVVEDEEMVQHLIFLAEITGLRSFNYDFVWGNSPIWPRSKTLAQDFEILRDEIDNHSLSTNKLTDEQTEHIKTKLFPLLSGFSTMTARGWLGVVAEVAYMVMNGHSPDEAIETVEGRFGEPAARHAIRRLDEAGLLRSTLVQLHRGADLKKIVPRRIP